MKIRTLSNTCIPEEVLDEMAYEFLLSASRTIIHLEDDVYNEVLERFSRHDKKGTRKSED